MLQGKIEICSFVLDFDIILTAKVISWLSVTCLCVSWLSHTRIGTTVLSKVTDYFSQMHQRCPEKNHQKDSLPHLCIKPATAISQIRYTTY